MIVDKKTLLTLAHEISPSRSRSFGASTLTVAGWPPRRPTTSSCPPPPATLRRRSAARVRACRKAAEWNVRAPDTVFPELLQPPAQLPAARVVKVTASTWSGCRHRWPPRRDPVRDGAGLSRPSARDHRHRATECGSNLTLLRIEPASSSSGLDFTPATDRDPRPSPGLTGGQPVWKTDGSSASAPAGQSARIRNGDSCAQRRRCRRPHPAQGGLSLATPPSA